MRSRSLILSTLLCALFVSISHAQDLIQQRTVATPLGMQPKNAQPSVGLPARGLSMEFVQRNYGTPTQKYTAVGNPPITRWIYPGYVVYFEGNYVIQAVLGRN